MIKRSAPRATVVSTLLAIAVTASVAGCAAIAADTGATRAASAGRAGHSSRALLDRTPAPAAVVVRHFVLPDSHRMTVARFTGAVRFVLHCGSVDPGPPCRGKAAGPALSLTERRLVIGAFNGGFKLSAHVGGYEQGGAVISPLVPGRASLVIYRSGAASIGTWGHGVPQPGNPVYSVRQNLVLLVRHGRPTAASAGGWGSWGGTITGAADTARSALGENARGQLIYVASMSATPGDLAAALARAGAATGMELDINPEWVQLAYARGPGGPLRRGITGQVRPASQYVMGWTRDFIAVLAKWPPSPAPGVRAVP
ncbi:MAG TPA: hypothetical protein VMU94_20035 [Streptosporangiaceae bacterium]|nr:hypothetical protein [Streptosporangiaceae bacterium]